MISYIIDLWSTTVGYVSLLSYHTVRFYHWVMIHWQKKNTIKDSDEVFTTENYTVFYEDGRRITSAESGSPDNASIVKNVSLHNGRNNEVIKRCCVIYPNQTENPFIPTRVPWWFIGVVTDKEEICITDEMAAYIVAGNIITSTFLHMLHPEITNIVRWYYIDPATFEETEIPLEGIMIRRDVSENTSHSEEISNSE